MCGIAGIVYYNSGRVNEVDLSGMAETLVHRGPDHQGVWVSASGLAGFAHRRLSIIDLHPSGNQPMHSSDGRFTIVFNGEIYNYLELRNELTRKGRHFNSSSDTEVLLALYELKGDSFLSDLDGMFSLAIWDEREHTLFCARDRFGEKPFFFHVQEDRIVFASEIKAIRNFVKGLNPDLSILQDMLLTRRKLGNEETCFHGVSVLPPAHLLKWVDGRISLSRYWDLAFSPKESDLSEASMIEHFDELLNLSIQRRLRSDVAYGSSLSGGIDSSAVVCRIRQLDERPFFTFSARFKGPKDEGSWIGEVIRKTGLPNIQVWPEPVGLMESLDDLVWHHEFPIGSASVYAQWCVMKSARENGTKVLLDGQGADEYLAGYDELKYFVIWSLFRSGELTSFFHEKRMLKEISGGRSGLGYKFLLDSFLLPFGIRRPVFKNGKSLKEQLYYYVTNNLGELLRYADRNSMAHSVEVRLPFLYHPLVEFTMGLPDRMIYRNGRTKHILRESSRPVLPEVIYNRTDKIGYEPPQSMWLSAPSSLDRVEAANSHLKSVGMDSGKDPFMALVVSTLIKRFSAS